MHMGYQSPGDRGVIYIPLIYKTCGLYHENNQLLFYENINIVF